MEQRQRIIRDMDAKELAKLPMLDNLGAMIKPKSEKEEKYLREVVEYEFFNAKDPGIEFNSIYGSTNERAQLVMAHGSKHKLPRFIANFIKAKGTSQYKWEPNSDGSFRKSPSGRDLRFQLNETF